MLKPIIMSIALLFGSAAQAVDFEYKVYFGLSKTEGAVSLAAWEKFEASFAKAFTGFTVTSATGYYLASKERSRVITLLLDECKEPLLQAEARRYAQEFEQQSVLITKTKLEVWKSVGVDGAQELDDHCPVG